VFGALCNIYFNKKLSVDQRQGMHFLCNEEKEKRISDYVDIGSAKARKRVQDAETANMQEQEYMGNSENA
jgi:hypothetical protein